MSHLFSDHKNYKFYCRYCGSGEGGTPLKDIRIHIINHIQKFNEKDVLDLFYNQYCKTCDVRQNKEFK